jgi:hypothetical protein
MHHPGAKVGGTEMTITQEGAPDLAELVGRMFMD